MDQLIIDVDEPSTWPVHVRATVEDTANRLRGTTEYTSDLDVDHEEDDAFCADLAGSLLRAYHCTRLMDHEVAMIRQRGLVPLSLELIEHRIAEALARSLLSQEEADRLRTSNVFAEKHRTIDVREGKVCLVLSRTPFHEYGAGGLWNPMTIWGGEGIYMSRSGTEFEPRLRQLGRPSVVVLGFDIAGDGGRVLIFPGILKAFVGQLLGLTNPGAEVHFFGAIPPPQIIDIWQPGHPDYDRYRELPDSRGT